MSELPDGKIDSETSNPDETLARAYVDGAAGEGRPGENATQLQQPTKGKPLVMLMLEADPALAEVCVEAIRSAMTANQMYYSKTAKEWTKEPDGRTRLAGAQVYLQYIVGLPLQRIHAQTVTTSNDPRALEVLLEKSPAMLEAVERTIVRLRAKAAEGMKRARPTE